MLNCVLWEFWNFFQAKILSSHCHPTISSNFVFCFIVWIERPLVAENTICVFHLANIFDLLVLLYVYMTHKTFKRCYCVIIWNSWQIHAQNIFIFMTIFDENYFPGIFNLCVNAPLPGCWDNQARVKGELSTILFLRLLRSSRMILPPERLCQRASVPRLTISKRCVWTVYLLSGWERTEVFLSLFSWWRRRHLCHTCGRNCAGTTHLFLTRQRMTHSASWMERSASSITSLLEPRTTMLTVFPGLVQPVIYMKQNMLTRSKQLQHSHTGYSSYSAVRNFLVVLFLLFFQLIGDLCSSHWPIGLIDQQTGSPSVRLFGKVTTYTSSVPSFTKSDFHTGIHEFVEN